MLGCARDRVHRRLPQAPPPPLARPSGRWKLLGLAPITVGAGSSLQREHELHDRRLRARRRLDARPLASASTSCSSSSSPAPRTARTSPTGSTASRPARRDHRCSRSSRSPASRGSARATPARAATRYLDLAILGAALIGGTIGFLWYNAFPAEVFMGDTGSMALGGAHRRLRDHDQDRDPAPR